MKNNKKYLKKTNKEVPSSVVTEHLMLLQLARNKAEEITLGVGKPDFKNAF